MPHTRVPQTHAEPLKIHRCLKHTQISRTHASPSNTCESLHTKVPKRHVVQNTQRPPKLMQLSKHTYPQNTLRAPCTCRPPNMQRPLQTHAEPLTHSNSPNAHRLSNTRRHPQAALPPRHMHACCPFPVDPWTHIGPPDLQWRRPTLWLLEAEWSAAPGESRGLGSLWEVSIWGGSHIWRLHGGHRLHRCRWQGTVGIFVVILGTIGV